MRPRFAHRDDVGMRVANALPARLHSGLVWEQAAGTRTQAGVAKRRHPMAHVVPHRTVAAVVGGVVVGGGAGRRDVRREAMPTKTTWQSLQPTGVDGLLSARGTAAGASSRRRTTDTAEAVVL